jgi:DNA-binding PadR family transcriptional regulator
VKQVSDHFLPLSTAALHLLLALVAKDRHGYGIMQDIAQQSGGVYKLGPGTLDDNLQKLTADRLMQDSENTGTGGAARRRYYRLTKLGREVLTTSIVSFKGSTGRLYARTPQCLKILLRDSCR